MALTGLHRNWQNGSYQADRDYLIKRLENPELAAGKNLSKWLRPHWDTYRSIAFGYGLDLLVNRNNTINNYLSAAGLATLSAEDMTLLDAARLIRPADRSRAYLEDLASRLSITLPSEPDASRLLGVVVSSYETQLDNRLGYTMPESKERFALVSMVYNGGAGGIKDELKAAILNDNRAEAWFVIRYNSNGSGIYANRRYKESDMFGIYDAGGVDEASAKEVMRMWTIHQKEMENYERSHPPSSAGSSSRFTNINNARLYLIQNFGEGRDAIITKVIVGEGLDSYAYKDGIPDDEKLEGSINTDLIFGEAGNDKIYAYNGNDIIYGGDGADEIYGGYGDDILNGGSGVNILNGGTEYDIYKIVSKDGGENIIQDEDGDGCVMFNDAVLGGGTNANTVSSIYYTDGVNIYEWDGHNGSDLTINGTTRVENFYNTKLGINLIDEKGGNNDKPPNNSGGSKYPPGGGADGNVDDTDDAFDGAGDMYDDGKNIPVPTPESPIILDLDGDGVETTHLKDGSYFDHDGNGFSEQTGWAAPDDGMLVRDIDGNGSIDNGKELFGNETLLNDGTKAANGFQALSELDDNKDGKIDANDVAVVSFQLSIK